VVVLSNSRSARAAATVTGLRVMVIRTGVRSAA
jgi:hypothetical protein